MSELTHDHGHSKRFKLDKAWIATGLILVAVALLDRAQLVPTLRFATGAF